MKITLLGERERELESRGKAIESKEQRIGKLEGIIAKFQRTLFGQKRERIGSSDQLSLLFKTTAELQQAMQVELTERWSTSTGNQNLHIQRGTWRR